MLFKCYDQWIDLSSSIDNDAETINCLVRKKPVPLLPEELVRQAFLHLLTKNLNIDLDIFTLKVEHKNIDIAIFQKSLTKYFEPYRNPLLIIELKKKHSCLYKLESSEQLKKYMDQNSCKNGILLNCEEILHFFNENCFRKVKISLSDVMKLLVAKNENDDIEIFLNAKNGCVESFLLLVEKYGMNSRFEFLTSEYKTPVKAFLLSIRSSYIFFDICGISSKKNQRKMHVEGFVKLFSITG
jgi:hypothetical protein